jgi:prepilin-type N-terminal cleavage/methylation domain-containing protein
MKVIKKQGFTLIELLVAIAIIGVLVTIVVAAIDPVKLINDAKDSRLRSNLNQVKASLQSYYNDCKTYPPANVMDALLVDTASPDPMGGTSDADGVDNTVGTTCDNNQLYMKQVPADAGYDYTLVDAQNYMIVANLSTTQSNRIADDTNSLTKCGAATNNDAIDYAVCND